jgi:hypothetical protein
MKYYKRWHEYCDSKKPKNNSKFVAGWVRTPKDLKKLINKLNNKKTNKITE